jgi:hypothetical protein
MEWKRFKRRRIGKLFSKGGLDGMDPFQDAYFNMIGKTGLIEPVPVSW